MQSIVKFFVNKCVVLVLAITAFFSLAAHSQTTGTLPPEVKEMLPAGIDPTQMSKSSLDNYFRDKNRAVGFY